MNLKLILFFSIILLIFSVGAVSSADVNQIDVVDSSGFGDESLDVGDFSESTELAVEDNLILQESANSVDSDKGRLLDAMETNGDSLDDEESWKADSEYSGKIIRERTIPIDLRQSIDALKEKLNVKESLPDVACEAYELEDFNLYVSFMDNSGTASGESIREKLSGMYQVIIPKEHSNTLVLKQDIRPIDKKIIIKITNGKDIIIDGQGHTIDLKGSSKHDHYFVVKSGNVIFKNINFINVYNKDSDKGGAISFEDKAIGTIINCTFKNCWAEDYGGAIADRTGNKLTLINSTFIGNKASDDDGGAIFCKGPMYAEGCIFENNHADDYGGAIDIESDKPSTFKKCIFKSNCAGDDNGGAIFSKGLLNIEDCLFNSNKAKCDGGAIFCKKDVNVIRSVFNSNKASGALAQQCQGGAILSEETIYIDNCTFENNTSDDYGGSVYADYIYINKNQDKQSFNTFFINSKSEDNEGGALHYLYEACIKNTVFRGNNAEWQGGAVFTMNGNLSATNCLFDSIGHLDN